MSMRQSGRRLLSAIGFAVTIFTGSFIPVTAYADTSLGRLYPIAISAQTLAGVASNTVIRDISNGSQPGHFGWLTWSGNSGTPTFVASLTPPGNSGTYINPDNPRDHVISVGDWIRGPPGVSNSKQVREALSGLATRDIVLPVWDQTRKYGANTGYRVAGFVNVRILSYKLQDHDRITARFLGFVSYGEPSKAPVANSFAVTNLEDHVIQVTLSGAVAASGHTPFECHDPAGHSRHSCNGHSKDGERDGCHDSDVQSRHSCSGHPKERDHDACHERDETELNLAFSLVENPHFGKVGILSSNKVTYTPSPNFYGTDTLKYVATAGRLTSATATVTIVTLPVNDIPIAQNQNVATLEDQAVNGVVMASDVDGDMLTFSLLGQGGKGTVALNADGTFTYTPAANMNGIDSFTFVANDGQTNSEPGAVTITLSPVNDAPRLSVSGEQTVSQGALLMFDTNRLISVSDVDSGTNLLRLCLSSTRGTLALGSTNGLTWLEGMNNPTNRVVLGTLDDLNAALNGLTYDSSGVSGKDVITLTVDDLGNTGAGGSLTDTQTITVLVTVTEVRTLTVDAGPDQILGWTNQTVNLNARVSAEGHPAGGRVTAEWSLVSGPTNKINFYFGSETLTLPANGQPVAYAALATFFAPGQYVLRLTVNDGTTQAVDEVAFTFILPDDMPLVALSQTVVTREETEVIFDLMGYAVHDRQMVFVIIDPPKHGKLHERGEWLEGGYFSGLKSTRNSLECAYQPKAGFTGLDSFTFWVMDENSFSEATVSILVLPADDLLKVRRVDLTTEQDTPVSLILSGMDKDNAHKAFTVTTPPQHGSVILHQYPAGGSSFTAVYTPASTYCGPDQFVVQASDGQTVSWTETVTITVIPVTFVVDAGPDQSLTAPGTLSLSGSVQLQAPVPGAQTTIVWSKMSGPGKVTFAEPGSLATAASFEEAGAFMLALSVEYGDVRKTDMLKVVVTLPGPLSQSFTRSSSGTDFWLTGLGNANPHLFDDTRPGMCEGQANLVITSEVDTKGLATWDITELAYDWEDDADWGDLMIVTHYEQPFTVRAGVPTYIPITESSHRVVLQQTACYFYQMLSDHVTPSAVHVTANDPVSVCEMDYADSTSEGYLAFPTALLGTNYLVMSYRNSPALSNTNRVIGGTGFAVVAPHNDTHVTILPSADSGLRVAGVPFEVVLQSSEVYRLDNEEDPEADFTGTEITADKPVAVISGSKITTVPSLTPYGDNLSEQMPPVNMWGERFISLPLSTRANGDTFRFLAAQDSTQISINGVAIATLNRGEFHERLIDGPAEIVSSRPLLVAQFSNSSNYDGNINSDPSMVLVPAVEQYGTSHVFGTPQEWNWGPDYLEPFKNYVNIIAPASALASVTLDGLTIPSDLFTPLAASGYYGAQIPIEAGAHSVKASAPICATVYGWQWYASYAYLAGLYFNPAEAGLSLQVQQTTPYAATGSEKAVVARVTDGQGNPVPDTRIQFTVTGVHSLSAWGLTSQNGEAAFAYYGGTAGVDLIRASLGEVQSTVTNTWTHPGTNHPPLIVLNPFQRISPGIWHELTAVVNDDALPSGVVPEVTWRVLSGPSLLELLTTGQASAAGFFESPGEYTVEATASDGELSTRALALVTVNEAPEVTLNVYYGYWEEISSGDEFYAGETLSLSAEVSDKDGRVIRVEFFDGDTKIGEVFPPNDDSLSAGESFLADRFEYVLPEDVGIHTFTACVTDSDGEQSRSSAFSVKVQRIGLTLRQTSSTTRVDDYLQLVATLTASDGKPVERPLSGLANTVSFTVTGAHSLGEDASVNVFGDAELWYVGTSCGTDVIEARYGDQVVAVTNLWVASGGDNQPPVIEVPDTFQIATAGKPFYPRFTVTDDGPTNQLTAFWRVWEGPFRPVFSDPHSLSTSILFQEDLSFSYQDYGLELVVSDSVLSSSAYFTVHVNAPPKPGWFELVAFEPQMIFYVSFFDEYDSRVSVDLYEGETLLQSTYENYSYLYVDPPRNGNLVFTARYTDEQGAVSVSEPIYVTAGNPPTLDWLTPSNAGRVFTERPVTLSVHADDTDGTVTNVSYYLKQGIIKIPVGQGVGPNFNYDWLPPATGDFVLVAVATDNDGLTSSNVTQRIQVEPAITRISFVSPSDGSSAYCQRPVPITLALSDPLKRFDHAEIFANNVSVGQTTNTSLTWVPAQAGNCLLTAKIYEKGGASRTADNAVNILVIPSPQPVVTLTTPVDGSRMPVNEETVVVVNLYDPAGLTTDLRFYVNGTLVGQNATRFAWMPTQLGSNALQCVARTTDGDSISSATVNVIVAEMHPPTVSLLSPTNGQWFAAGSVPLLSAQASDQDGSITVLTLTLDGMVLAEGAATALEALASDAVPGWHEAAAAATDNDGLETASEVIRFFIERNENPVLPVPVQLSATAWSASEIQLSWLPLATNELMQSIIVERWNDAQSLWTEIAEVQAVGTNDLDMGLAPETNYRYRMACVDTNGCRSAYSEEASATTRTVVPTYAVLDLSASLSGVLANRLPGGNILTNTGLTHFDSRRTGPLGTRHAEAVLGAHAVVLSRAVARFTETWPQVRLDLDPVLLSPQSILPRLGYLTGPGGSGVTVSEATAQRFDPADPSTPVKAFVQEHGDLFGFGPGEFDTAVVQRDYVSPLTAARTMVWQQQVAGIPVFGALFIGHVTATNELAAVSCSFIPSPTQAANPAVLGAVQAGSAFPVTAPQALVTAVANAGDLFALTDITAQSAVVGVTRGQSLAARKGIKGEAYAGLTWFPVSRNELVLAWQVIFTSQWRNEMFLTVVSALDNQILYRRNLTFTGSPATYRVYTGSSPAPLSPGLPVPGTGQPAPLARSLVTLDALDATASPAGWINDGDNETRGNNVDAHLDRNDDDEPDLPRPTGSPARTFDFALDPAAGPRSYGDAAAVQLFYWNNWMHDVLYGLGFTEAGGNFQNDNFGRGGLEGDAVQADAQDGVYLNDGKHRDNANMSVPPDGYAPRMQMYVFDGATPARDGSLDAEVILHEYTHGLSIRTMGGGAGIDALQTAGMAEGWSDFYALALLADPAADVDAAYPFGAYVAYHGFGSSFDQNNYYGIRRYPYSTDLNKNPLTFADIDPAQAGAHPDVPCNPLIGSGSASEVHRQGEVWGVMLWEVRASLIKKHGYELGNSLSLALVTEGLRLSPPNPNVVQARDAILLADRMLSEGADAPELWAAFSKRGLGYGAKAPYAYSAVGVRESSELPPALLAEQVEVLGGNGNGIIETNEVNDLLLMLRNQGEGPATQVSVQLSTATPGVQLLQAQSVYGDISPNQSCVNAVLFRIATLPEFVDGTPVELSVTMTSAQGVSSGALSFYTGGSGPALPSGDTGLNEATSLSAEMKDLTPKDLGALEPLWMADDASCLLKAAKGKYVLWRPYGDPVLMENPNFTAHRVKWGGDVVGELARETITDTQGNVFRNTVGALWTPGNPKPSTMGAGSYTYPKEVQVGEYVGLAYDGANLTDGAPSYLGGVTVYPKLTALWDLNSNNLSAGSVSVYLRPSDTDHDGMIGTNDVVHAPMLWSQYEADGKIAWMNVGERMATAGYAGKAVRDVFYNAMLVSAARFGPGSDWSWLGPLKFSVTGSVFSQALLINDRGDIAGTGATLTGDPFVDACGPTRVFRWSEANGEFTLGESRVTELGLLPGGQHGFPYAMNQGGDIAGYSDFDIQDPLQLHAVLWRAGQTAPQALGALSKEPGAEYGYSVAYALNDSQQVVGTSRKYIDGNSGALMNAGALWQWNAAKTGTPGWEISDLDRRVTDPDWRVLNAVGISANGWMLGHAQRAMRDGQGNYTGYELRAVLLMPGDLDIDSDNNAGQYGSPDRSAGEDRIEDSDDQPGKIVIVNNDDSDGDGIPDFADGFDRDIANTYDNASSDDQFVPLILELPLPIDLNVARLEFVYSASDPAEVKCEGAPPVWKPAEGALRIWTVNAQFPRNKRSAAAANDPGQYVAPNVSTPASALGFSQAEGIRTNTFYVEGIQRNATNGSERILVRLDPDGPGPLGCVDLDAVRVAVCDVALIPDYDRDGIINDADRRRAATNETYRFWINDDADISANEGSNVPGAAKPDYADGIVNGLRDLSDWFPVMIDISRAADTLDLGQFTYWLCHEGGAVNVLSDPDRQPYAFDHTKCNGHVFDPDIAGQFGAARTLQVRAGGVRLKADFMQSLMRGRSTVLLEGRTMTRGTCKSLTLEIRTKKFGKLVCRSKLFVSLDSITGMYRQLNLRSVCGGTGGMRTRTGEPPNLPDVSETDIKHIVYVHGYNINGVDALGEQSAVFKNLWWCGSNARFHGVSWYGDATQIPNKGVTVNFYTNTANAFATAPYVANFIKGLRAESSDSVTVIAHSLGNMVASAAISIHKAPAANYFMLDAAVAQEAYLPRDSSIRVSGMINANWDSLTSTGLPNKLFASEWHTLFNTSDARSQLTWRGLFTNWGDTAVCNFYSSGEDVLDNAPKEYANDWTSVDMFNMRRYVWCTQEKLKGRMPDKVNLLSHPYWWNAWVAGGLVDAILPPLQITLTPFVNEWATAFVNEAYPNKDGGWMVNERNLIQCYSKPMDWIGTVRQRRMTVAEMLDPVISGEAIWTLMPLFTLPAPLTDIDDAIASPYAAENRGRLLAQVFPATTYAMGKNRFGVVGEGIDDWDMNDLKMSMIHGWHQDVESQYWKWTHSDFKDVCLLYTQELYKEMVTQGEFK